MVMTSQTVGRLPALSRPARDEPTETTDNNRLVSAGDREPVSKAAFTHVDLIICETTPRGQGDGTTFIGRDGVLGH